MSSIWIVFVLSVRIPVARWLGARWAYKLWLVPLLGLLAMGIPNQPVQRILNVPGIELTIANSVIESASSILNSSNKPYELKATQIIGIGQSSISELLVITWGLGALFFILYFSTRSIQYSRKVYRASWALSNQQVSLVRMRCPGLSNIEIRILSSIAGPAVAGLVKPMLLLPVDFFQRYTNQQQTLVLEHERQHLRRHDLIYLLLARVYRCLFWFNPLVYFAERYLQLDQELSCDEKVLATRNRGIRRIYGETLLSSAHTHFNFAQAGYLPSFRQIRQRTNMLKHYHQQVSGSLLGGLLLMISVSASITYGVLGSPPNEPALELREALRLPIVEAVKKLETSVISDDELMLMLSTLKKLEVTNLEQALNDYELAQLNNVLALVYFQLGDDKQSLSLYENVVSLTNQAPGLQSGALNNIGLIQYTRGNYVETIKLLVQSQKVNPANVSADSWALRSRAFTRLQHWDKSLRYIKFAIKQAEIDNDIPQKNWLLSQTAFEWKLGDLTAAARTLERSIAFYPETTYEQTLVVFNQLVQEVWEPLSTGESLALF